MLIPLNALAGFHLLVKPNVSYVVVSAIPQGGLPVNENFIESDTFHEKF